MAISAGTAREAWATRPPGQGGLVHGLRALPPPRLTAVHNVLAALVNVMEAEDVEARFSFSEA